MKSVEYIQWIVVIAVMVLFFVVSPRAKSIKDFFRGSSSIETAPNVLFLTSGLVISWIFAKSIANAASLGNAYGLLGGLGYAGYYVSFLVAGFVIYNLRVKGKWTSIHSFLISRFGKNATRVFSVLIAIRLFNEVWSNTMVLGSFFGETGSLPYYGAILLFTGLTLAYVLKGGLKSSMYTDFIQMMLFVLFLGIIVIAVLPSFSGQTLDAQFWGIWDLDHGVDFLLLALIQSLSYPFHDPVLTDRGFITEPKKMRKSFIWAAIIGILCITLFSLVGVAIRMTDPTSNLIGFSKGLGVVLFLFVNLIMVTSATSTLDSTFSSFSKLWVVDIRKKNISISAGRWAMVALAAIGSIPVFLNAEILQATTISGTMVIGLAPIFLLWNLNAPKASFYLAIGIGLLCGITQAAGWIPSNWLWSNGKYADLLFINTLGLLATFAGFLAPYFILKWQKN